MINMPPGERQKVYGLEYVSTAVSIEGFVDNPCTFTAEALLQRPQVIIKDVDIRCGSGKLKEEGLTYAGVLLRDLLEVSRMRLEEHEVPNRTCIVATGADGYRALYSWHEIFNSPLGEGLVAVLTKNVQVLGEKEGELCLVSTRDERPGPRCIRYLCKVEVCRLE
ncbi:oxidoreductase molybdopterin-binding protein [Gracilinema caldarium]|uniref:Oxidoreductase, molybdopterin binding protein n=1 Tax=Gracilinema caldarium (strain ATCC 51460 / DSM 7334 / H1) TaxID=744872 RepID=F8F1A8_GRAC1|nr:oxidoreductase molybdopterin-binding protein [Gracilinema caldarium]AEJ18752.1 oxidoreductase, molybdopterin binding protein [Gracilinema caldarium DSM 7334]